MVREYRFEVNFPTCTPKEFFEAIYADEVSLKLYLKLNTVFGAFSISPWNDKTRVVEFTKEMKLPAAIAALTGSTSLPVKDIQTLQQSENGEFTVSSTPILQMSIGTYFKGTTEVTAKWKDGGCLVEVAILCEASGPWGLINAIESFMEEEAKLGVESFLIFCEARLADLKSEKSSIDGSSDEHFYDVRYESMSQVSVSGFESHTEDKDGLDDDDDDDDNGDGDGLTADERIALRLKRIEEETQLAVTSIDKILRKIECMEQNLHYTQRTSYFTILGVSFLSFALAASLIVMKSHRQS